MDEMLPFTLKTPHNGAAPLAEHSSGEWDFTSHQTQYLTHGMHPYLASMIPQIPNKLLSLYANKGTKVFDPFVGGGSVVVESFLEGYESTGIDINPLAVILSKAKSTYISEKVLVEAFEKFNVYFDGIESQSPEFPQIDFWFKENTIKDLAQVKAALEKIIGETDDQYKTDLQTFFQCVFSNTVRDVSLTYRGEVRLRKLRDADFDKFNPNTLIEFQKRYKDAANRVSKLPQDKIRPNIVEADTKNIPFEDKAFDLVITSPPYGDIKNTIPYHQFSKNMLYWLGIDDGVKKISDNALGFKDKEKSAHYSKTLEQAISYMSKPNLIHEAICFYADYYTALKEIARVTKERIVIVIGHRILDGTVVDNPAITTDLMDKLGWRLETTYKRAIKKKRIHRAMGFGNNAMGGTIDSESILVYAQL